MEPPGPDSSLSRGAGPIYIELQALGRVPLVISEQLMFARPVLHCWYVVALVLAVLAVQS